MESFQTNRYGNNGESKDNLKEEFSDIISNDLPEKPLKTEPKEIVMKEGNVQPLQVSRARPVHLHFQEQAYKLVEDLEKANIIRPVNYVTEWVSPSMFLPKPNGGVRMVTDYTAINKVIERPIHPSCRQPIQSDKLAQKPNSSQLWTRCPNNFRCLYRRRQCF